MGVFMFLYIASVLPGCCMLFVFLFKVSSFVTSSHFEAMTSYRYFRDRDELCAFLDTVTAEDTNLVSGELRINRIRTYYNNRSPFPDLWY